MKKKIFLTAALALLTFGCIGGGAAALTKTVEDTAITVNAAEAEQYTVTVSQADMGDTVITFGADTVLAEDGETVLVYAVNDLPNLVASMLPANTELATYAWAEAIPTTFELKNYTFTIVETRIAYQITVFYPRASFFAPAETYTVVLQPNATIDWAAIETEVKKKEIYGCTYSKLADVEDNAPTATTITEDIYVYANYTVDQYKLTIVNADGTETELVLGAMNAVGIDVTFDSLAFALDGMLPEDTELATYAWAETIPEAFELKDYTFTVVETRIAYQITVFYPAEGFGPMAPRDTYVATVAANAAIDWTAIEKAVKEGKTYEGKTFKGLIDLEENAPTATTATEDLYLYATYDFAQYTVTINYADGTSEEVKFAVEYDFANGIDISVNDLPYVLEDKLPAATELATYAWAEAIPETFELKDYTFTVVETRIAYQITVFYPRASFFAPAETYTVVLQPNAAIDWAAIETEVKKKEIYGCTYSKLADVEDNAPTATTITEDIYVYANYTVDQYKLTIVNADGTTTELVLGAMNAVGIDVTFDSLAFALDGMLPEDTDLATYAWAETIPETFELKDYTFTVVETLVEAPSTSETPDVPSTSETPNASETEKEDKKGGCGSVVGLVGSTAMLTLAGVALLGKKKED